MERKSQKERKEKKQIRPLETGDQRPSSHQKTSRNTGTSWQFCWKRRKVSLHSFSFFPFLSFPFLSFPFLFSFLFLFLLVCSASPVFVVCLQEDLVSKGLNILFPCFVIGNSTTSLCEFPLHLEKQKEERIEERRKKN